MKPEDLMIGDWFRVRYTFDDKDFVRTFCISITINDLGFVCGKGLGPVCLPEELEPIPLTSEILEKNGFSHNGLDIALFDRKDGDDFVGASNLQYVHELQHALKLCRIDKTIEL